MSLDVLFQQILRSEQNAEDRRCQIDQVNKEIVKCENEIKELSDNNEQVKTKIKKEDLCQLFEIQAEVEVFCKQSEILLQQCDKLKENIDKMKKTLIEITDKGDKYWDNFVSQVNSFFGTYDLLSGNASELVQRKSIEEFEKLKLDEASLEEEPYEKKNEKIILLFENHACLLAELSHLKSTIIDLNSHVDDKRKLVEKEKAKIKEVALSAQMDSEYCRLQAELQSLDGKATEAELIHLRAQLSHLQQNKTLNSV